MRTYGSPGGRMGFGGGMGITPAVKLLLIANAAVFVAQTLLGGGLTGRPGPLTQWLAFIPQSAIFGLEVWRFFTYMFLHGGLFHIGFNMFALWMFGTQIEARWGQRTFLVYYIVCGLGGAVTYGLFNLAGMDAFIPMVGASGAIYGILLAYGLTFPDAVILVGLLFPMKAKYAVLLFGLIELMSTASGSSGGVAHLAHLGGMLTGFIFLRLTVPSMAAGSRRSGGGGGFADIGGAWRRWQTRRRMRVVRPDERSGGAPGNGRSGADNGGFHTHGGQRAEIDAILDKISREGLQSLTEEEQEILRRAGRK
ncbi:rhomboid family intramembrane serine protease [bacterium]|nr:rhomboid family intramembrane serine protease [bacterium]